MDHHDDGAGRGRGGKFFHMPRFHGNNGPGYMKQPNYMHNFRKDQLANQNITFDGKRMRKAVWRRPVDYNTSVINYLENRIWQRDNEDQRVPATDPLYNGQLVPPPDLKNLPMNCVTTRFVRQSTNKLRCPIFCLCWTPEGRRLVTGASSGEFTLWNGLTFNFETILQAHDTSVRAMLWSHSDEWMVTADHAGFIKYWQSNMNNVKMYQAHKDPIRGLSLCPTDQKFASCSDDGTVRIWDFLRCSEERILRGHGADVKCVDWHPQKALIASGSKDTQQPVKLWDPRTGRSLATVHAHKHTVMEVSWNQNGNWLVTASRDHLLKIFDVRKMKEELQTFKGHKKEATTLAWHPIHESLLCSGGSDGSILFWLVGQDKEVGAIEEAHETMVWGLAWHPLGHILASASNDHSTKFWTRNRPGDRMRDRYNLNTLPVGIGEEMLEYDTSDQPAANIPGMGLEYGLPDHLQKPKVSEEDSSSLASVAAIPGLEDFDDKKGQGGSKKKVPFAKPIPKQFEAAWEGGQQPDQLVQKVGAKPPPNGPNPGMPHGMGQPPPGMQVPPPGFQKGPPMYRFGGPNQPPPRGQGPPPRGQGPPPRGQGPPPRGQGPPRPPPSGGPRPGQFQGQQDPSQNPSHFGRNPNQRPRGPPPPNQSFGGPRPRFGGSNGHQFRGPPPNQYGNSNGPDYGSFSSNSSSNFNQGDSFNSDSSQNDWGQGPGFGGEMDGNSQNSNNQNYGGNRSMGRGGMMSMEGGQPAQKRLRGAESGENNYGEQNWGEQDSNNFQNQGRGGKWMGPPRGAMRGGRGAPPMRGGRGAPPMRGGRGGFGS